MDVGDSGLLSVAFTAATAAAASDDDDDSEVVRFRVGDVMLLPVTDNNYNDHNQSTNKKLVLTSDL